jgi:hypothetical protein
MICSSGSTRKSESGEIKMHFHHMRLKTVLGAALLLVASNCGGTDSASTNENEVFTTVTLKFTSASGAAPITVAVDDPDGDGGNSPTIQPLNLPAGMYEMSVKFENKLENPAEDITLEVLDESSDHQVFFRGTAVNGPASNQPSAPLTHAYSDVDAKGLPVGIVNAITAMPGAGMLTVTLRHMPPINGMAVKTAGVSEQVRKDSGFASIGGSSDVQVTFPVTVQ